MRMTYLKKIIITAGIAAITLSNSYASKNVSIPGKDRDYANSVYVNDTISDQKHVDIRKGSGTTYNVTRTEAEKSLDALCRYKTTHKEDAWIQYGDTLIDIGQNEKRNRISLSDELMDKCINKTNPGDTITMYHIHPEAYFGNIFHPACTNDVLAHISIKSPEYTKGRTIIAKVFDGRGMWEFDADEQHLIDTTLYWKEIKKQFNNIDDAINGKYGIDMWDHTNTLPLKKKQKSKQSRTLNQYDPISIQKYISTMERLGIKLKFTPTEELQKR